VRTAPSATRSSSGVVAVAVLASALVATAFAATGCAPQAAAPGAGTGKIAVVAAEDFWGSVAAQVGGSKVSVTSIITNPATDPHDYEPTVADARAIARAKLMIENGIGYDTWATRLVAADPNSERLAIDVGQLAGVAVGGNPHQWYSPTTLHEVIAAITADYKRLDPADAAYFDQQRQAYETQGLATYDSLISDIRSKYAGTPIGASESVVAPIAEALGLRVLTPASFLNAIGEGTGPTAADKATVDAQIRTRQIKVFVFNEQNATPDVTALVAEAKAVGIPVVTVTETMVPASGTFQDWQSAQLAELAAALKQATGR
jgi:zinc/manganese transport system substrate-binding protein